MLNPPECTWLLLPIFIAFHYHIHSHSQSCRCVFIVNAQNCIKHTTKVFLPAWCCWQVWCWNSAPLASHSLSCCLSFKAFSYTKLCFILYFLPLLLWITSGPSPGAKIFFYSFTYLMGEGGGGCNKNSPLHRWELLSQFYSFFVNGKWLVVLLHPSPPPNRPPCYPPAWDLSDPKLNYTPATLHPFPSLSH